MYMSLRELCLINFSVHVRKITARAEVKKQNR